MVTNLLNNNMQLIEMVEFNIQFVKCSSKLTENERKCLMRKHRRKHYYDKIEPLAKKSFFRIINNDTQKWIQKRRKKDFLSKKKNTSH